MLRKGIWAATAVAAAWGQCAVAQVAAPADREAALFGALESATGLHLSPSGTFVSYVAHSPRDGGVGFVANVKTGETKPFLKSGQGREKLRWCAFVTDQRLVCRYTAIMEDAGQLLGFQRLIAINSDGSAIRRLGERSSLYDASSRQYEGEILDWLPGSGGSVLMARQYVPEVGKGPTRLARSRSGVGVDRVDTLTLKVTPVERPRSEVSGYMSDGSGNVRLMATAGLFDEQMLTGKTKYYYRPTGSKEWKSLTDFVDDDKFTPLAVDAATDSLYALKPLNGRKALYRIKLEDGLATELIASHPKVDIDDVVRSADHQRVIGYTFIVDKREVEYFDPEYKALSEALGRAIPNLPLIDFEDASVDGNRVLVFAGSDNDPGRYFVFDKKAKSLAEILLVRPELENYKLATIKAVSVVTPDGVSIPAYLTMPPGSEARNLPAVVLPHGGPSSRDEWGFDWIAQYLAAKGYAVLQPEYRGSAGFGDAWLMQNGFKSWKTSIGDITASAHWLVSQGIANPKRLAVVGWSYGGYAALQSAVSEPSLFKAVAAVAPVTDFGMIKQEAAGYINRDVVADFVGSGPDLVAASPLRHASAIKVPVLLAHGDLDQNVGVAESDRMAAALKAAGTPVEYLRFKELDHQLEDSGARTQLLTEIGKLLERTIGH